MTPKGKMSLEYHPHAGYRNDYIHIRSNACVSVNSNSVDFNLPGFKPVQKDYTPNQYEEESAADGAVEEMKSGDDGSSFHGFRSRSHTRTVVDSRKQSTIVSKKMPRQMIPGQMSASVKQMQQFNS